MYKYIIYIIGMCFLAGCSNESDSQEKQEHEKSNLLTINAGPAMHINLARATIETDTFPENTVVGVFVTGKKYERKVAYYTLKKPKWEYPDVSRIYLNEDTATVFAFYPSNSTLLTLGQDSLHKIQIRVAKSDTIFTDKNQTDYMFATGAYDEHTKTYPQPKVSYRAGEINIANLFFHHAFSQICFVINKSEGYKGTGKLTKLELKTTKTNPFRIGKGTMNVNGGAISLPDTCTSLTFSGDTIINAYADPASTKRLVSRLLPPMEVLSGITLHLTIDGTYMFVALPTNVIPKWEQGKKYVYTLCLENSGFVFEDLILEDWITQIVSPVVITM